MNKHRIIGPLAAFALALCLSTSGCAKKDTADKVEDAIKSAGDKVGDAANKAVDKSEDAASKAKEKVKDKVN